MYLSVKNGQSTNSQSKTNNSFIQVYTGTESKCIVRADVLEQAFIDQTSAKSAILFRIAAKNEKGYGPATQVRWLQQGF